MLCSIHFRELTSRNQSVSSKFAGLRSYQLFKLLPRTALEDVFLGFSSCGQFLVSYRLDFKQCLLHFWLFPPVINHSTGELRLHLFAEVAISRVTYVSRFQDSPCVRFIQSLMDPSSFLFLSCDFDGSGLITAFGLMPDTECSSCIAHCQYLNDPSPALCRTPCLVHVRILVLNLDLASVIPRDTSVYSNNDDNDSGGCNNSDDLFSTSLDCEFVPPCYRNLGGLSVYDDEGGQKENCTCFASTSWLIGSIQVNVCPLTGRLRIAWVNPDAQIKVLSCSFITPKPGPQWPFLHMFPQGTSRYYSAEPTPLAFMQPLLTQNYCSRCYSWPAMDKPSCTIHRDSLLHMPSIDPFKCIFVQVPARVVWVDKPTSWPDNHIQPDATSVFYSHQQCSDLHALPTYPGSNLFSKNGPLCRVRYPAILSRRPTFASCMELTYLGMLEDIRASYIHWSLSPLLVPFFHHMNERHQSGTFSLVDHDSTDEASPTTSHSTSPDDQIAVMLSPDSQDEPLSPEDLLAHRLSGQCHTSFDSTSWRELGGRISGCGVNEKGGIPPDIIAHLEEVVFDMPSQSMDRKSTLELESEIVNPGLCLFLPPDEPDLLLIYRVHSSSPSKNGFSELHSSSPKESSSSTKYCACLLAGIDLTTGERVSLPSLNQEWASDSLRKISRVRLLELTAQCPQLRPQNQKSQKLVYELNNYRMTCSLESLKVLIDPQGGYAVHW
ncbi:unnamed protein product [Calicophoron daubneyi]|uniref:DDB1- and CUL4-associated factor 15 WD40 repeat-containing domain-containing protein n=1 Tax=Calicophoron daubneyi TaxID=300641 RepID=A0AAV2SXB1_CALDB